MRQWLRLPSTSAVLLGFALLCFVVEAKLSIECNFSLFIIGCFSKLGCYFDIYSFKCWQSLDVFRWTWCVIIFQWTKSEAEPLTWLWQGKKMILTQVNGGRSRQYNWRHVCLLNIKLQKCFPNVPTVSALSCNCHQQKWGSRSCHLAVRCKCLYGVEETPQWFPSFCWHRSMCVFAF